MLIKCWTARKSNETLAALENSPAAAFLVMAAIFIAGANWGNGRASAQAAPGSHHVQPSTQAYPPAPVGLVQSNAQFGLIQTGVVGVVAGDGGGQNVMPVFQVVMLQQPGQRALASSYSAHDPAPARSAVVSPPQQLAPEGTTPAPVAAQAPMGVDSMLAGQGVACQVNNVMLMTSSPEACASVGGTAAPL